MVWNWNMNHPTEVHNIKSTFKINTGNMRKSLQNNKKYKQLIPCFGSRWGLKALCLTKLAEVATVNLNDVRSMRSNFIARSYQASSTPTVQRVEVEQCEGFRSKPCCSKSPVIQTSSRGTVLGGAVVKLPRRGGLLLLSPCSFEHRRVSTHRAAWLGAVAVLLEENT